ncbi:MAG: hypothetical protein ACXACK_15905 [Candidatus Hodarchaeales archaeon]|jgi:hypothetical protein
MEPNKHKIQEILEKIEQAKKNDDWDKINTQIREKRLTWFDTIKNELKPEETDVRTAYTLFLIQYLGIKPAEVPIIFENDKKIIWRSYNWCPVLEACKKGGFDTRDVCKRGWEQSVQNFIEKVNPRLQFQRNYEKIRPYYPYCEEVIELVD